MFKKFTGTLLAASIALTSITAVPAQAGSNDAAKIAAGIATLLILGKALESRSDSRRSEPVEQSVQRQFRYNNLYDQQYDKPRRQRNKWRKLPTKCKFTVRGHRGPRQVFGSRCLKKNYHFAENLPRFCKDTVRVRNGHRRIYGAHCLKNQGYRIGSSKH